MVPSSRVISDPQYGVLEIYELRRVSGEPPPTLREIAKTAPYMHDGSLATLEEEGPVGEFLERHLDFLAEEEHKGWEEQRRMEGWTYGKPKDNARCRHPLLVPYAELPSEEKDKDRRTIRNYPVYARAAGFKIVGAR